MARRAPSERRGVSDRAIREGAALRAWREKRGLGLHRIAVELGVVIDTVSCWELGKRAISDRHRRRLREMGAPIAPPARVVAPLDREQRIVREARKSVLGYRWNADNSDKPFRLRAVSREVDRLRAEAGLAPLVVNEPPPGWTREEDEREEWTALSQHLALRKVS